MACSITQTETSSEAVCTQCIVPFRRVADGATPLVNSTVPQQLKKLLSPRRVLVGLCEAIRVDVCRSQSTSTSVWDELAVLDQILYCSVMQRPIDIDSQLEVDTLSRQQSFENRSDVVTTPGACNKPSCCILCRLQTLKHQVVCNAAQKWITVVQATEMKAWTGIE